MKSILHIALNDIRLMVKDKVFFFWTLVFPLVFIVVFGNVYKESTPVKASLLVLNQDKGQWGSSFVKKLESPDIALETVEAEPDSYHRILIIPKDFSENIALGKAQELIFRKHSKASVNAAAHAETRIIQAIAKTITELMLNSSEDLQSISEEPHKYRDIIEIKSQYPENTITVIPTGFDHTIPGVTTQFIMMMVLIYGGITVMEDRKRGVLQRILYSSTSVAGLWGGKFLGRFMMGIVQAFILIFTGLLFFGFNMGDPFLFILNIVIFSVTMSSLSIFIGSVIEKEDLIIGVSVLTANIFAALGGCWWPIEIVSGTFRSIAVISPAYWAMDAFHQIIFFNGGFSDISMNFIILLVWAMAFTWLAVRYFRIKE